MDSIDEVHDEQPLWHAALRSALGPLAAYLTPENYGLSAVSLSALQSADDEFQAEIDKRLDLARALQVIEIIETIGSDLPQSYRHYVHYCEDRIDGALLIPRLVQERTAGRHKRIPWFCGRRGSRKPRKPFWSVKAYGYQAGSRRRGETGGEPKETCWRSGTQARGNGSAPALGLAEVQIPTGAYITCCDCQKPNHCRLERARCTTRQADRRDARRLEGRDRSGWSDFLSSFERSAFRRPALRTHLPRLAAGRAKGLGP